MANARTRILSALALALIATRCGTVGVDPANPGYKALNAGNYEKARDIFWALHAKNPSDPWVTLDLAESFDGLGRMDLAGPFYQQVIDDGGDIAAQATTDAEKGKTLAQIACERLRHGLNDATAC